MRSLLTLILIFFSFVTLGQDINLKLASDVWAPFTNVNEKRGIARDIVKQALSRSAIMSENHIVEFEDVLEGIKSGKYDGSAALWQSNEREEYLLYSMPYLHNQLILVGRKGSDVSAKSLSQLSGKKIAIVGTYTYGEKIEKAAKVNEIIKGVSDQENLTKLLKEEADYMLVDHLLIQYLMAYQKEETAKYLEIGKNNILHRSLHFALRKDVPDAALIMAAFNRNIIRMMSDGAYNKILKLNWIESDINGDGQPELILRGDFAGETAPTSSYDVLFNTTPSSTPLNNSGGGYYIQGKLYKTWEEVPKEYKKTGTPDDLERVRILNFAF